MFDRPTLRLDAVIKILEIVERLEPPRHVVEPDLALLLQGRVFTELKADYLDNGPGRSNLRYGWVRSSG